MEVNINQKETKAERAKRYREILNPKKQDLGEIINTKKTYYISNPYDILRVIARVNKDNKLSLKIHDITYRYLSDNDILITAKGNAKTICGKVNIKVAKDAHKRFIIIAAILATFIIIAIGVCLLVGIYFWVGKDNQQIGLALVASGGTIFVISFILLIVLILKWPTILSSTKRKELY